MTRVDSYLRAALDFWTEKKGQNDSLPRQYKGYVASFGTAVLHCGLTPAVFMFSGNENSNTDEDKSFIVEGISKILNVKAHKSLLDYVLENDNPVTEARVCDAAIALKLALRTFKLSDHA